MLLLGILVMMMVVVDFGVICGLCQVCRVGTGTRDRCGNDNIGWRTRRAAGGDVGGLIGREGDPGLGACTMRAGPIESIRSVCDTLLLVVVLLLLILSLQT